jgi:hypothetical protein
VEERATGRVVGTATAWRGESCGEPMARHRGSVALSLCTAAHPLRPRLTNISGP